MDVTTVKNFVFARTGVLPKPVILEFELTHLCNLSCVYCDRNKRLPHEMDLKQILVALEEFHRLGMRYIGLDGGEPLTHPNFEDIIQWLNERNIVIHLNSNGTLLKKKLDLIKSVKQLKISIDGSREIHDIMRGKGSFDKAIEGAILARQSGIATELRCVLGKHNVNAVDELVDLVEGLDEGITLMFQPVRNSLFIGSSRDGSTFMADTDAIHRALRRVEERKVANGRIVNKWGSLSHFRSYPNNTKIPCAAGWIKATMDPEGYLFHCGMVGRNNKKINVVRMGAEAAFSTLNRYSCTQCWCARAVEGNLAWGGKFIQLYKRPFA